MYFKRKQRRLRSFIVYGRNLSLSVEEVETLEQFSSFGNNMISSYLMDAHEYKTPHLFLDFNFCFESDNKKS